jgi:hypothetical protein
VTFPSDDTFPGDGLVEQADVEAALVRPLTANEATYIGRNIDRVVRDLRNKMRTIDARMAAWDVAPRPDTAVDPDKVRDVLAGVLKRYLTNTEGAASISRTDGPFSTNRSFASYGHAIDDTDTSEINGTSGTSRHGAWRAADRAHPGPHHGGSCARRVRQHDAERDSGEGGRPVRAGRLNRDPSR